MTDVMSSCLKQKNGCCVGIIKLTTCKHTNNRGVKNKELAIQIIFTKLKRSKTKRCVPKLIWKIHYLLSIKWQMMHQSNY